MHSAKEYASIAYRIFEGDDYLEDTLLGMMAEDGFVDKKDFTWIYEDEVTWDESKICGSPKKKKS